ncbi:CD3337/EF1877 family mobilome membrane protein, partial [Listeria monocytogenes]|uniref:CD3337/EF1877 family mobilome membrane protein n=1 Tax=Listeria monocytogenes TaxID=1639 RepID=UPI00397E7475
MKPSIVNRIKSNWTLKRLGKVAMTVAFTLVIAIFLLAMLGTWTISLYVSNATGYLVQEAYSLDFISATADSIGKNMQTLAGVSANGFSTEGFYVGFLLLLILVLGVYVAYTGLIKRETTKAIHAIMNFVLV